MIHSYTSEPAFLMISIKLYQLTVWGGDTTEEGQYPGEAFIWQLVSTT